MIKYLGSKRLLIPRILELLVAGPGRRTALDLFSGTARVGHALKRHGFRVHANDHNAYAGTLATCYVQADRDHWHARAERLLGELDALPGAPGWFTETYCERSRYLRPENGARVDSIRARIAALALEPELEAIALTSLMEAADRVDSTTGVQMAYLKQWAPRASRRLELRVPELLPGPGSASCLDALAAARAFEADVAYLDPPYNQHSYLGNYHVWESLVRWDKPEVYGIAHKRLDVRERGSRFNRRGENAEAMRELIGAVRARVLVVSFNDEGFVSPSEMRELLAARGAVREIEIPYRRYVGARIGIYNPQGEKVGVPGRLVNVERLFVVETEASQKAAKPRPARRRARASLVVASLLCALGLATAPIAARAAGWTLAIQGGTSVPIFKYTDEDLTDAQSGWQVAWSGDYRFTPLWALGLEGSWSGNPHGDTGETFDQGGVPFTIESGEYATWQVGAHARFYFPSEGPLSPYMLVGSGVSRTTQEIVTSHEESPGGSVLTQETRKSTAPVLALRLGIGVEWWASNSWALVTETDFLRMNTNGSAFDLPSLMQVGVRAGFSLAVPWGQK